MGVFLAVYRREFRSYFATPIALIFLTVYLILNGVFTFKLGRFYEAGQADLRAFFVWHPWLYLFIVPAVSMRLWAEERRSGTIELLLTLPVTVSQAMLGKFFAAWTFLGLALVLTFPTVLTLCYLGDPDMGVVFASYLGSLLMSGTFLAIGCCVSAATSNQVVSFVVSTSVCLVLILLGFEPVVNTLMDICERFDFFPVFAQGLASIGLSELSETVLGMSLSGVVDYLVHLSFPYHFEAIQRGVITLPDLIYFSSVVLFGLFVGVLIVDHYQRD